MFDGVHRSCSNFENQTHFQQINKSNGQFKGVSKLKVGKIRVLVRASATSAIAPFHQFSGLLLLSQFFCQLVQILHPSIEILITRKYSLRGYILGVLTHTTAWDGLWGGDVFLRFYIRSSASPHVAAV